MSRSHQSHPGAVGLLKDGTKPAQSDPSEASRGVGQMELGKNAVGLKPVDPPPAAGGPGPGSGDGD